MFALTSCGYFKHPNVIEASEFKSFDKEELLCFDLTDDDKIRGAVLVRTGHDLNDRSIILPFSISDVENSEDILSTTASYDNRSLICFKGSANNEREFSTIKYVPAVTDWPDDMLTEEQMEDGVYYKRNGLERRFIFRCINPGHLHQKYVSLRLDTIKSVGIKLPPKIRGIALANGSMYDPAPLLKNGDLRYFESKGQALTKVEINYLLPANNKQIAVFEFIMKLLGVITLPVIDLVFLKPNPRLSPRTKKRWRIGLITFEFAGLAVLIALTSMGSIASDKISDLTIFFIGAVLTAVVAFYKSADTP